MRAPPTRSFTIYIVLDSSVKSKLSANKKQKFVKFRDDFPFIAKGFVYYFQKYDLMDKKRIPVFTTSSFNLYSIKISYLARFPIW